MENNCGLIEAIKKEAVEARLLEAFLESVPQFIMQWSIVFWTGVICECLPVCPVNFTKVCRLCVLEMLKALSDLVTFEIALLTKS